MNIDPFPEQHDLIAFFECEAILADEHVPLAYNRLTFQTQLDNEQVVCEILPGEKVLKFQWKKDGDSFVCLNVDRVKEIHIEVENKREALVAKFESETLLPLRIQLKPSISVLWGTDNEIKS